MKLHACFCEMMAEMFVSGNELQLWLKITCYTAFALELVSLCFFEASFSFVWNEKEVRKCNIFRFFKLVLFSMRLK